MPRPLQHAFCTVEGCGRPHKAQGYCASHYQQSKRGEPIRPLQERRYDNPTTCTVECCDKPERSKGLCGAHYVQLWRTGDPMAKRRGAEK